MFCPAADRDDDVQRCLEMIAPVENIYTTVASLPAMCAPEKYPYPSALRYISAANEILGSGRIMWGSDIPITVTHSSYAELIDYIQDNLELCDRDLENIYSKTAKKVYGL
jgi:predicted TIM-barrel fold metal-dependent hydrolase